MIRPRHHHLDRFVWVAGPVQDLDPHELAIHAALGGGFAWSVGILADGSRVVGWLPRLRHDRRWPGNNRFQEQE